MLAARLFAVSTLYDACNGDQPDEYDLVGTPRASRPLTDQLPYRLVPQ